MRNETISLIIAVIMCSMVVIALVLAIIWNIKKKTDGFKRVISTVVSVLLVIAAACNLACYRFSNVISTYFAEANATEEEKKQVADNSYELVKELVGEGAVLLENKDAALPLDEGSKLNVFGQYSVSLTYGGSGSGGGDETDNITLQQGLESAGFEINSELTDLYNETIPEKKETDLQNMDGGDYMGREPDISKFSEEILENAKNFSDTALIVLSRNGGEGGDLPIDMGEYTGDEGKHYLELSSSEEAMLEMVKNLDFENVIVLINSSNAMELGFLEESWIDAALWIGGPGVSGCDSIGNVLKGTINPSGRLVDTYAYDLTSSPAYYNAGSFLYSNAPYEMVNYLTGTSQDVYQAFVNYTEGIYIGYRYYETRWVDNQTGQIDEEAYGEAVQYPFGYGLSYTTFNQSMQGFNVDNATISVDVEVENTGNVSGKDVVQIYYTPPYYSGGIEKSHVVLAGFAKIKVLAPGESEIVNIEFSVEDMASYDYVDNQCYVLDKGTYEIKLMENAHVLLDSREYIVDDTIVFDSENKRESDDTAAVNQFDDVTYGGDISYVSRADWEGTLPTERTEDKDASQELIDALNNLEVVDNPEDEDIVLKDNGLEFSDMTGAEYDDPRWEKLLEQITPEEMAELVGMGGYITVEIPSINKPRTSESEGPAGVSGFMNDIQGVQYCSAVVVASTWNTELANRMGVTIAQEEKVYGFDGAMAPAMNIHRTPFSGRNFEYYSEDPFISGKMGANVIQGYRSEGVNTFVKHFALNDQESNRCGLCVWANEQSMREIYFKPFEMAVKEGGTLAMMSSTNRIGSTYAGNSYALLTTILRDEWGFRGTVVTDMARNYYQVPDQEIRAGNDLMLAPTGMIPDERSTETNTGKQALRRATHNILYTLANSCAMDMADRQNTKTWLFVLGIADIIILAAATTGLYKLTHRSGKKTLNIEK